MKNAIILHGAPEKEHYYDPEKPSESNSHWLPWLQKELIIRDIHALTPEIPHAHEPRWELWCREVERFDITPGTMLVGHSAGAGFFLKYLSVHPELKAGRVVLVAPWMDPDNTIEERSFFEFDWDPEIAGRTGGMSVFYAPDDSGSVQQTVAAIRKHTRGITFKKFPEGYGHFTYENLGSSRFPELLEELTNRPRAR